MDIVGWVGFVCEYVSVQVMVKGLVCCKVDLENFVLVIYRELVSWMMLLDFCVGDQDRDVVVIVKYVF